MGNQGVFKSSYPAADSAACYFFHFGLIVTGKGERDHLPKLFRSLAETKICAFDIIGFVGQRGPITSPRRKLKMIGDGKTIPTKDEQEIGLPARKYLCNDVCRWVIVVDDLEHARRVQAQQVFDRYRLALDTMLTASQQRRAAVHFLVNMLEAYYLADARAVNAVLGLDPPLIDHKGDVETIVNPKADLKTRYPGFKEVDDGGKILGQLDVEHVLSRPDTCAWLRTLFAWCAKILERYPFYDSLSLSGKYRLCDGLQSEVTCAQSNNI